MYPSIQESTEYCDSMQKLANYVEPENQKKFRRKAAEKLQKKIETTKAKIQKVGSKPTKEEEVSEVKEKEIAEKTDVLYIKKDKQLTA